jgi:hypothetical protein
MLAGGGGHNKPVKKAGKKKKAPTAEEDRLRRLLLALIKEFVLPANPERGKQLLGALYGEGDPNDSLEGLYAEPDDESEVDME